MPKDFDRWNDHKKEVEARAGGVRFHEREIWWCSLGVNVGSEQDGVSKNFERPVLVVRNFNSRVLWILPLTRTVKPSRFFYRLDEMPGDSAVVLSQLRLISSKRLLRKIRTLDERQFRQIVDMLKRLLPE
jgi:mRNA-degrading endonuclease toxin of MazEF toxin-antitoxin module